MRKLAYLAALLCLVPIPVFSQQPGKPLTNQDIVDMVDLGLSDDVIIAKVNTAAEAGSIDFDTSAEALKFLKVAHVSDAVIKVILNPPTPSKPAVAASPTRDLNLPPAQIGLYWKNGATFVPVQGHLSTQTKARATGRGSGGMFAYGRPGVREKVTMEGATSPSQIKDTHPAFYFYLPEGTTAADFVLIKLSKKSDKREFQVEPAGSGNKSIIKKEDETSFKAENAGPGTYKITLDAALKPGEYAFLMSHGAISVLGDPNMGNPADRIYDFTVTE